MSDTSSSATKRVQRIVRQHEVLRIAGQLSYNHQPNVADATIREVLKWVQRRCGGQLPTEAWEHKSFDYLSGGRNSSCVRLQSATSDLWAIRADDPDKTIANRVWSTEVVVGLLQNQPIQFSTRLLVSTPESELKIGPHTPGFIQQIVGNCGIFKDKKSVCLEPTVFETEADTEKLIEYMIDPSRSLPIFAITLDENKESNHSILDIASLSRAVLGTGYVAVLHPAATWRLTEKFGKLRSVFGGAARVYLPGFSGDADPYIHHLVLANQLDTIESATRAARWMKQLAAKESILRTKLGRDVLSFSTIRNINLQLRQEGLRDEAASPNEQLKAADELIDSLKNQISSLNYEQEYYIEEYEKERARAEISESQAHKSAYHIQNLIKQIKDKGDDPDIDIAFPTNWSEFSAWCDEKLAGRLILTPNAHRATRNPLFTNTEIAARCLLWLASDCRDQRIDGGNGSINNIAIMDGIQNASCGSDTYDFDWNGRSFSADWHIKNGGNTRDPSRCLRIYYCFDPQTQQIIVSDMPEHRRTNAT